MNYYLACSGTDNQSILIRCENMAMARIICYDILHQSKQPFDEDLYDDEIRRVAKDLKNYPMFLNESLSLGTRRGYVLGDEHMVVNMNPNSPDFLIPPTFKAVGDFVAYLNREEKIDLLTSLPPL